VTGHDEVLVRPSESLVPPQLPPAEVRLQLAQEAGRVGLWEWDARSGATTWDAVCASIFGIALADFEGTLEGFGRRTHPDDLDAVTAALDEAVRTGGTFVSNYRALLPDGTQRRLLARGRALVDADGTSTGVLGAVVDVTDLEAAVAARARSAETLARLAEVAMQLAAARTVEDLVRVVVQHGLSVLGADGGAVCVRDDERDVVRLSVSESLPERVQIEFAELPLDGPLPGSWVARHGRAVLLQDRAAGLAFTPAMQIVYDGTGRHRWATLPLPAGDRALGSLVVSWRDEHPFDVQEIELLGAFAAQCAQALERIQALEAERNAAQAALRMSEALQRSLLTPPPQPDHLQLAVRYRPASQLAQVGGDWYDAFLTPDGATQIVIGDVTGHDRDAAARMGAIRNLLRGTAYARAATPAQVLVALERALEGLEVDALATAVLGRIEQTPDQQACGVRLLRWSSAGHLPPLLLSADGTATVLDTEPNLLLGLIPDAPRHDHVVELRNGDTVLLYTDGLVERRGASVDEGVEQLRRLLEELAPERPTLDDLLDTVLARMRADDGEDDVALIAVRLHHQDRPRPAEAGARTVPADTTDIPLRH
jgi:serine phosphatase RsbU (regulator of sigma subunit)